MTEHQTKTETRTAKAAQQKQTTVAEKPPVAAERGISQDEAVGEVFRHPELLKKCHQVGPATSFQPVEESPAQGTEVPAQNKQG